MDQARRQAKKEKDLVNVHDTEEKFLASMNMGSEEDNLDKYGHGQRFQMITRMVLSKQLRPNCCYYPSFLVFLYYLVSGEV